MPDPTDAPIAFDSIKTVQDICAEYKRIRPILDAAKGLMTILYPLGAAVVAAIEIVLDRTCSVSGAPTPSLVRTLSAAPAPFSSVAFTPVATSKSISPADLRFGDVLLLEALLVSVLIEFFDGSAYSHAALYTGDLKVMEALDKGITYHDLRESVGSTAVDVFRLHNSKGDILGSDAFSPRPVMDRVEWYKQHNDGYAYDSLLLLALLTQTRHVDIPLLSPVIRTLCDQAAAFVESLMNQGKTPVICSELVYRCFSEAGSDYAPFILGADLAKEAIAVNLGRSTQPLSAEGQRLLIKYQIARRRDPMHTAATLAALPTVAQAGIGDLAMRSLTVPNFVTPRDLSQSPSFIQLGRLAL